MDGHPEARLRAISACLWDDERDSARCTAVTNDLGLAAAGWDAVIQQKDAPARQLLRGRASTNLLISPAGRIVHSDIDSLILADVLSRSAVAHAGADDATPSPSPQPSPPPRGNR
jgi:hypothetical protein